MKIFLKVEIPVKAGNALAKKGKLGETIQSILKEQKPEAVYFTEMNGNRTALIFVNLTDASGETLNNRSNSIRVVNDVF